MRAFRGPDVVLQPVHQRQVVGEAAHQAHRRVRVRVDEPRYEGVLGQLDTLVIGEAGPRRPGRKHRFDLAVAERDGMLRQDCAGRLDRNQPAWQEEVVRYLGVPWISTTTRRLGDRHSISALRSFWSGHDFSGRVLPKPRVSTFEASTPLETR